MRAEIISCGTELLLGHITDTNATYLARRLATLGIDLYFISQVGDNQGHLVETLRRAWGRAELIIVTGGLGPTEDDLTRESISSLLGETMQVDSALESNLQDMFAKRNARMPLSNLKQATLIPSAQTLPNPLGTAPGWWIEKDKRIVIAMPGEPREMYRMWEQEVIPRLKPLTGGLIFTRTLRIFGVRESIIEEQLGSLVHSNNPTVATYAELDATEVRITAKGETSEEAERRVIKAERQIRQLLGHHIFGADKDTLQSIVGNHLRTRMQTLAVMESLTGGLLASTITDVSGSSTYFIGGLVTYSTELKARMGVPREILEKYGAVSEETARAMALAARKNLGADFGLGITGVAGPDEQEGKAVGTVHIAVDGPDGVAALKELGWPTSREGNKRFAVLAALNLLRLCLERTVGG